MVTLDQAQAAKEDLANVYMYQDPWQQHVNLMVAYELKRIRREWPPEERDDRCVLVGLETPLPEPYKIALQHNGVRVVTVACGTVPHAASDLT